MVPLDDRGYRVSVFAQRLGTSIPVSPQRLKRQWQKLQVSGDTANPVRHECCMGPIAFGGSRLFSSGLLRMFVVRAVARPRTCPTSPKGFCSLVLPSVGR